MTDRKKEFQRIFEFIVKHNNGVIPWENKVTKRLLRWALFYKKLFVVYDHSRIAGLAIAWRTTHPENSYDDLGVEKTEAGDFMHVYRVIIHPDYRSRGLMFQLLVMGMLRFRGVKTVFWTQRKCGEKKRLVIQPVNKVLMELAKWQAKTKTSRSHLKSRPKT